MFVAGGFDSWKEPLGVWRLFGEMLPEQRLELFDH